MIVRRFRSLPEYSAQYARLTQTRASRSAHESEAEQPRGGPSFTVRGYSYPARLTVDFVVRRASRAGERTNWRETASCPVTGLNSRLRASVHLLDCELGLCPDDRLYLPEQSTPLYRYFRSKHCDLIGSEYLGPKGLGEEDSARGLRNEDLTQLTLADESVDVVGCFECLEHIPRDGDAMGEMFRVLRPGGRLLVSVPFVANRAETLLRAEVDSTGSIVHHEPPEYHGDPLSSSGCLCFRHYGWDLVSRLRGAGFKDAYGVSYWSDAFCYYGAHQIMFVALK